MNEPLSPALLGRVASLHLHPDEPGEPMRLVNSISVEAGKGIVGSRRYFGRPSRSTGAPTRRQVSLIEREQLGEHATALGLETIPPGAVRSNIETLGVNLVAHVGDNVKIGEAVLFLYEPRTPCSKMDCVCHGLRALMEHNRQGVMAEAVVTGHIRVGDQIWLVRSPVREQVSAQSAS